MSRLVASFVVLLVALQCIQFAAAATNTCGKFKLTDYKGKKQTYDFSALAKLAEPFSVSDAQYKYEFRVCSNMVCPFPAVSAAACQEWDDGRAGANLAVWASPTPAPRAVTTGNGGVTFELTGGLEGRRAEITVFCDPKASKPTNFAVESPNSLSDPYKLSLTHKSGCGSKSGLSAGSVMLIILFVTLAVYFIAGFIFLKFARGAEGVEAIPNHEFWFGLPGLVKDGVMFVVNKIRGGPSSYETVA